jgi:hypothetical protein
MVASPVILKEYHEGTKECKIFFRALRVFRGLNREICHKEHEGREE